MKWLIVPLLILAGCGSPEANSTCIEINTDHDFAKIVDAGNVVEYENNIWQLNDEPIGYAEYEDEAFIACGSPDVIDTLLTGK